MVKVLAGGCFNKIHPGHVYFLKQAKKYGKLTVVIANDANNRKRYAAPAWQRKKMIEELGIADKVIIGVAKDFSRTVKKEKPDIIALGYDQKNPVPGFPGRVVRIKKYGKYSSSVESRRQLIHALAGIVTSLFVFALPKTITAPLLFIGIAVLISMLSVPAFRKIVMVFERRGVYIGNGAIFFFLGCLVTAIVFDARTAAAAIMILALGDSAATYFGRNFGKMRYSSKTAEGSIIGMLFAFAGASFFVPLTTAFYASLAFVFVEAVADKLDDNLIIPVVCAYVISLL